MKFLLDTNMFLVPGKFKVDVFSELEKFGKSSFYTLDLVVKELEQLARGKTANARAAKLGLELIQKKNVEILQTQGKPTDDEIINIAKSKGFTVCTQDKKLIERLEEEKIPVIYLRQKRYLERK